VGGQAPSFVMKPGWPKADEKGRSKRGPSALSMKPACGKIDRNLGAQISGPLASEAAEMRCGFDRLVLARSVTHEDPLSGPAAG
jgi:hypothetical protein